MVAGLPLVGWLVCIAPVVLSGLRLFLCVAALGLSCCTQSFSSCCERGIPFLVVQGRLITVTPPLAKPRL